MIKNKPWFKFLLTILIISVTLIISGCPANNSDEGPGDKITLKVINYARGDDTVFQNKIFNDFMALNPDIKIQREDLFSEAFFSKVDNYINSGSLPDVLFVWPVGRSSELHMKKMLKNLEPFIDKDGLKSKFKNEALDPDNQIGGYIAMLPQGISVSHVFYINLEVLEDCGLEPVTTYTELKSQMPVLAAKGYKTVLMPNKDDWVIQSCLFSMVAGRFLGAGWEKKINDGIVSFTDTGFINALNFIKTMYDDDVLDSSSLYLEYEDGMEQFKANASAYYIDGDWRAGDLINLSPDKKEKFKVTVFPEIADTAFNKSTSLVLGTGWAMNAAIPAKSDKEDAAWRLIKWLTGVEVQSTMLKDGRLSSLSRVDVDFNTIAWAPIIKEIANLYKKYDTSTAIIDVVFNNNVSGAINSGLRQIGLGYKTPNAVAHDIQDAFDS